MANLRMTEEQLEQYNAKRARECAALDEIPRERGAQYGQGVPGGGLQENPREVAQVQRPAPTSAAAAPGANGSRGELPEFVDIGVGAMRLPRGAVVDTDQWRDGSAVDQRIVYPPQAGSTPARVASKAAAADAGSCEAPAGPLASESSAAAAPRLDLEPLRSMTFALPVPPSVNSLYGQNHQTGAKYLLPEQRQFRSAVIGIVRAALRVYEGRVPPLLGRLRVDVYHFQADRTRQDISNRQKALEDALEHAGAYKNDSQIDELHIYRRFATDSGCIVHLREIA